MPNDKSLKNLTKTLPNVNPDRNYWLIRTSAGVHYEEFICKNYIAIGWNEVLISDLAELTASPTDMILGNRIKSKVKRDGFDVEIEPSRGIRAYQSRVIAQLLKFTNEIKKGDIVVIPSENSDFLSFGEVVSTRMNNVTDIEMSTSLCPFRKRKSVTWIKKNVSRNSLESSLYRFIFSHQTINNVDLYANQINSSLYDYYKVGEQSVLVLRVREENDLDAFKIESLYSDLTWFIKEFCDFEGIKISKNSLNVKFALQSPGFIELSGLLESGLIVLGILTVLAGGSMGASYTKGKGFDFHLNANSLLDSLNSFLNGNQDRRERTFQLMRGLKEFKVEENKNLNFLSDSVKEQPKIDKTDDLEN